MVKRTLKDLNVLDDFLFNELISRDEKGAEFCRILLETILDRPIRNVKVLAQRKLQGRGISERGIVMDAYIEELPEQNGSDAEINTDIYDIEPTKYKEGAEPKRGRYYHALMDTKLLKTGVEYKDMRNVTIIMILPYDPYGKDRMIYTISSQCEEDRSVSYEDGLKTIYLYTKGKVGNTSQKLRDMLRYIEESTQENAVNDDLQHIHRLVTEVKQDEEVELGYMKMWELEARIRRESEREGREAGMQAGMEAGRLEARTEGIRILAESYEELGIEEEKAIAKISEKYNISEEEVRRYLEKE